VVKHGGTYMATRIQTLRHKFSGGWATDFGTNADVAIAQDGLIQVPFLVDAENVFYELDGGPRKIGGTEKVNTSVLESGAVVRGVYDFWRQGALGSPTRRRIAAVSDKILSDTDDGTFTTTLASGWNTTAVPNFSTFDDILIMANDSTTDVPRSWDGTTAQSLAGTPPRFSFSTTHYGRQFAAGDYANPSTLYYTTAYNPEDWTGSGSGSILIEPNDGDMITGIASYKRELWIFKGPNKGSINRLTGSAPASFALEPFVKSGLGAAWQNSIFQYKDDLGFVSQYGTIHSLTATASYGDFNEGALSLPIHKWISEHMNFNRLRHITAVNNPQEGYVLFTISVDASTTNNTVLMMDYRDSRPGLPRIRWAQWTAIKAGSMGLFVDTNGKRRIVLGGNDGFVRRSNVATRSLDGTTAIAAKVTLPFLNYGNSMLKKTLYNGSIGIAPKGNYTATFGWTRDDNAQQTTTVTQGGGDVLGPASENEFTLGTSTLGGALFVDRYMDLTEAGEFRNIQYQLTQSGAGEDLECHSLNVSIKGGSMSLEN